MRTHSRHTQTQLLYIPRLNEADFEYKQGADEDIDLLINRHSPYDPEDDSQEFYSRLVFGEKRRVHEKH